MIFESIHKELTEHDFETVVIDNIRPWCGFFVIAEEQSQYFAIYED